jgi:hypothetical protein
MKKFLRFKAGPGILPIIREEGLRPERVRVFAGPAGGPKWFVSVGFDKAIIKSQFLEKSSFKRVLLAGASAGAWRCLAMACKDPLSAYEKLRIAYSRNIFTSSDNPGTVSDKIRDNVRGFINEEDIDHILNHSKFDLAIHVVRSKHLAASDNQKLEGFALLMSAGLNVIKADLMALFYERAIFYSSSTKPDFVSKGYKGLLARINEENIENVALATGSLPYLIRGVEGISGAPDGVYRDGGLLNYQLNQDYTPEEGLTLFFHYQEKITPGWFDKKLPWRKPSTKMLDRVLQIYPDESFKEILPGRKIPDRNDFLTFVDDPSERIRRWDEVCKTSEILADDFMETVESGQICNRVEPLIQK